MTYALSSSQACIYIYMNILITRYIMLHDSKHKEQYTRPGHVSNILLWFVDLLEDNGFFLLFLEKIWCIKKLCFFVQICELIFYKPTGRFFPVWWGRYGGTWSIISKTQGFYHPKTNMTMEYPAWMKIYFLLTHADFPVCHVSFRDFVRYSSKTTGGISSYPLELPTNVDRRSQASTSQGAVCRSC